MKKPKVLVLSGYGINCEEETKFAFEMAGGRADIIHINDLIDGRFKLDNYQILAIPGGFCYGDDTGAGNAYALKLKNHLWDKIENFVRKDHLVIGICNGFQVLVNLGLLPALDGQYGKREVALLHNDNARYTVRWVDLKIENKTPWFTGIENISLPIAHGEGKFFAPKKILAKLNKKGLVAARFLGVNPNGSLEDIAAITDESGRILGIMPHPERAIFFTQLPHWTNLAEKYKREGRPLPLEGPGLKVFKNAINYYEKK